jgi:hypothetical protein
VSAIRLERKKEILAELRLRRYFWRKGHDPTYSYPYLEDDLALARRKLKERGQSLSRKEGVG